MTDDREDEIIQYKVRPVIRWAVTRYHSYSHTNGKGGGAGSEGKGEFDSFNTAKDVGYALCSQEHKALGWALDDNRIQYPKDDTPEECLASAESERIEAAAAWERFRNSPEYANSQTVGNGAGI